MAAAAPVPAAAAPAVPAPGSAGHVGVPGTPRERTFVALKPDAVHRGLIGDILSRFEKKGLKLVACKLVRPTKAQAAAHYSDLSAKPFFPGLVDFFSSAPVLAMVFEGQDAARTVRQMLGTTNPKDSMPGSIRGDFCMVTGRNIIHASDAPATAADEIAMWFKPEEICEWTPATQVWLYEQ